ncbi:Cytochrome c553 [Methylobacterium sp. 174MFSha1.1]|uniref:c-type cytochrome n=1 Tax=Methylobacterium sp. 174MFSha1.1 TaxID=1502749 RepID=UPI0008EB9E8E|nr:c-type cytochrome [Methylobacterium sp. 174MFSha1.1]SFU30193.1 Cytochrome c553 [Methylobacterium sp. 174MFSha1.1]
MRAGILLLLLAATPAAAASPPGASSCSGCHGAPGGAVPSLSGRSAEDIAASLAAFRSGARPATVMNRIAKGFSESESRAIADYLAGGGQ